jgi:hypothetical protein
MTDDFHTAEDARKYRRRLKKQRGYTADWRDGLRGANLPERDDVAAACLRCVLRAYGRNPEGWDVFVNSILDELLRTKPDFDRAGTKNRISEMIDRQMTREARERAARRS